MKFRLFQKKLMFVHYLVNLDKKALASEIFDIQKEYNLPGLVEEGRKLVVYFSLPNIIDTKCTYSQLQWKLRVKAAINTKYEEILNSNISKSSKLREGPLKSEVFGEQSYLRVISMADARINFRIRSKMTHTKMNQQSDKAHAKSLWKCDECGNIDSQSHIVWCPFFADLREGKSLQNDDDLVEYFREVLNIREKRRTSEQ